MKKWHVIAFCGLLIMLLFALVLPDAGETWFHFGFTSYDADDVNWVLFSEVRLPRIVTAVLAGTCLSISGLLLQTLFNNPLAGPSILGLTSGAHLFVAIAVMGAGFISGSLPDLGITASAGLGALIFGMLIVLIAGRVRSQVSLLLIGMMLGTFVSAITGILQSQSDPNALKAFTMWSMGSLQNPDLAQIPLMTLVAAAGFIGALLIVKPLNALVLGERQATVLGVSVRKTQWAIMIVVSVLTGLITAFCGPIGFVGLIVPNLVKMFYKTADHRTLLIGSAFTGAFFMLFCDCIVRLLEPVIVLPINTLTSVFGAPVVVLLIIKKLPDA
jgi:iron complex transport system permease protein